MSHIARKHLRLVTLENRPDDVSLSSEKSAFQMETYVGVDQALPIYFVRESDVLHTTDFSEFLFGRNATLLFDVRVAPRLDFIASSRSLAFRKFASIGLEYFDLNGALSEYSDLFIPAMPEAWLDIVCSKLQAVDGPNKSIFFIFDDDRVLRRTQQVLPGVMRKAGQRDVRIEEFSGIDRDLIAM
jgi:hypothetical protein